MISILEKIAQCFSLYTDVIEVLHRKNWLDFDFTLHVKVIWGEYRFLSWQFT